MKKGPLFDEWSHNVVRSAFDAMLNFEFNFIKVFK